MKLIKTLPLLLIPFIGVGCSQKDSEPPDNLPLPLTYELKNFDEIIPGLSSIDLNSNEVLEKNEIIHRMKKDGQISQKEIDDFREIARKINLSAPYIGGFFFPPRLHSNVEETIDNINSVCNSYQTGISDGQVMSSTCNKS